MQRLSGDFVLARVLAVLETTFVAAIGLGAILAPALESLFGVRGALIVTGAALPLATAAAWSRLRSLEVGAPAPQEAFEALRRCRLFAPLPLATIEGLARRLVPLEVGTGTEVVTQGEVGDRFYLIIDGAVEILQDGVLRRRQGAGDSFGEIALLYDIRRTATVRALTSTHLFALDRDPFLLSVTGHTDSHDVGIEVADAFLGSSGSTSSRSSRAGDRRGAREAD